MGGAGWLVRAPRTKPTRYLPPRRAHVVTYRRGTIKPDVLIIEFLFPPPINPRVFDPILCGIPSDTRFWIIYVTTKASFDSSRAADIDDVSTTTT